MAESIEGEPVGMRSRLPLLALAACLVLAGCAGSTPADPADEPTPEADEPTVDPANPYEKESLTVAVNSSAAERNVTPDIERALAYWETESDDHAGYPIEYDLAPNASNPDIQLTFEDDIGLCGSSYSDSTLGCAPILNDSAPETVDVAIETGWTANTTETTITHELGHTLGLGHDDTPQEVMSAKFAATPVQQDVNITLVMDTRTHDREQVKTQLNHSLEYWDEWADEELAQNVSYTVDTSEVMVGGPDDLYLVVSDYPGHCGEASTCAETGTGLLGSQYLKVQLANPRTDAVGWLAGYYLGGVHGLDESEYPEAFQSNDSATDEWWDE